MNQKALKKEFKAECKSKKTKSYRYSLIGAIAATIGTAHCAGYISFRLWHAPVFLSPANCGLCHWCSDCRYRDGAGWNR